MRVCQLRDISGEIYLKNVRTYTFWLQVMRWKDAFALKKIIGFKVETQDTQISKEQLYQSIWEKKGNLLVSHTVSPQNERDNHSMDLSFESAFIQSL